MTEPVEEKDLGTIHISPTAIATIASNALLTCYGVVGMAAKNAIDGFTSTITRDPNHGVDVKYRNNRLSIDVYVIIQHGTRISSVTDSVINAVRYSVENMVGIPVDEVNINVQGLRVDSDDSQ